MPSRLIIVPARMQVSESGGTTKHRLICVGDKRLAFKVKLKQKYFKYYTVSPVIGFIQPGTTRELVFTRKAGKITHDYLVIQYIVAPPGYDPRQPFIKGSKIGKLKLKISVVEGKPKALPETAANGKFVSEEGQEWSKTVSKQEDERIEAEVLKLYKNPTCFQLVQRKEPEKVKNAEKLRKPEDMKQLKGKRKDIEEKKAAEQEEVAEGRKAAEERKAEEQRKAIEEKKKVEEQKKAAEEKVAEEKRKLEEQKKAAEEKAAEEKRKVEEQKKAAGEKKVEEEEKATAQRKAEERRKVEELKKAEEKKKAKAKKLPSKPSFGTKSSTGSVSTSSRTSQPSSTQKTTKIKRSPVSQVLSKASPRPKASKAVITKEQSAVKETVLVDQKAVQQPKSDEKDKLKSEAEKSVQVATPSAVAAEHIQGVKVNGQPSVDEALRDVLVATVPLQQPGAPPQAITVHVHLDGLQLLGLKALQAAQAQRARETADGVVAGDTSKPVQIATTAGGGVTTTPPPVSTTATTGVQETAGAVVVGDTSRPTQVATSVDGNVITTPPPVATAVTTGAQAITATPAVIESQMLATGATTTSATETPQQVLKQQVEVPGKRESDKANEQRPAGEIVSGSETKGEEKVEIIPTSAVAPLESRLDAEQAGVKATSQGERGITAAASGEAGRGITEQVVGTQSTGDHGAHPLAGAEVGAASKDFVKGKEEVGGGAPSVPVVTPVTGQTAPPQQEATGKQQQPVGDAQISGAVKGIPEQRAAKPEEPGRQREGMEAAASEEEESDNDEEIEEVTFCAPVGRAMKSVRAIKPKLEKEKKSGTKATSATSTTSQGSRVSTAKPTSSDESSAKPASSSALNEGVNTSGVKDKKVDYGGVDEQEYNYGGNEGGMPSEHYLFPSENAAPQKKETNSQDVNIPSKSDGELDKNGPDESPGGESGTDAPAVEAALNSVYL
uniref:MSP domain-containing protein n=1 Tax=Parascaris univalens TaxID=6257 RepID=A0A915AP14_PARUN